MTSVTNTAKGGHESSKRVAEREKKRERDGDDGGDREEA